MLKNWLVTEERIETSKTCGGGDKTQILPNVLAVVDVINLALNDYRSFLQKRRRTSSCHFNLRNTRHGMTSYDGHSHPPLALQSFALFLPLFRSRSGPSSTNWLGVQFRVPSCRPSRKALREEFRSSRGTCHDPCNTTALTLTSIFDTCFRVKFSFSTRQKSAIK